LINACASPTVRVSNVGVLGQPEFSALVWIANVAANTTTGPHAILQAYNALTGHIVFDSRQNSHDQLGQLPHYAPITCAGNSIYLGTDTGFALFRAVNPLFQQSTTKTRGSDF
jgi:hypothetical protein